VELVNARQAAHLELAWLIAVVSSVASGPIQARTLGPWSSAVELVNARQAAAEQRNKQLQQGQQEEGEGATAAQQQRPHVGAAAMKWSMT
jgi:DNA repair protein RAD7